MRVLRCVFVLLASMVCMHTAWAERMMRDVVGEQLPTMTFKYVLTDKPPVTEGKPLLIDFWAPYCMPCVAGIPHLNELYEKYKDQGLVVIGVTFQAEQLVQKVHSKTPMEYFVAIDRNSAWTKKFDVKVLPAAILVNKAGEIVWQGSTSELTESRIEELLSD